MRRIHLLVAALLAAVLSSVGPGIEAPPAAQAGTPGTWSFISGSRTVSAGATVSLVRSSDGVLHLTYPSQDGFGKDIIHGSILADGSSWSDAIVHTGFDSMNDYPVINKISTGLRIVYSGLNANPPGNPYSFGYVTEAEADNTAASWSVFSSGLYNDPQAYTSDGTGAVALSDDSPVTAIARGSEIRYGAGFGAGVSSFAQSHCCAYYATVVTDGTNAAVVWQGNGGTADSTGVFGRQIHPALGATTYQAPKSATLTGATYALSMSDQPTAAVQRTDGYTWVAYPVGYPTRTSVGLWQVGAASARFLTAGKDAQLVALATGPSGRMWLAWSVPGGTIKLVRTSATGAKLGGVRAIAKPSSATGVFQIALEATNSNVDVVINGGNGLYHTQVQPGLNFSASPQTWRPNTAKRVVFTVKDAGTPISGARVRAKGKSCTTSGAGTCAINFPQLRRGSFTASVTKSGYATGSLTLRVR